MKILFTGFSGFNNPTTQILKKIDNKILFNNSYKEIDKMINCIDFKMYDLIIMLGLRNNLKKSIRLEINSLLNDELLTTNINYNGLYKYFISHNIPCIINYSPTNYLCNYAYHKILKMNINTIFIHLPNLKNIKDINHLTDIILNINTSIT